MKMADVRQQAKLLGIKPGRKHRADLIREIQKAEGNFPCFRTAHGFCDQHECSWRKDCLGKDA